MLKWWEMEPDITHLSMEGQFKYQLVRRRLEGAGVDHTRGVYIAMYQSLTGDTIPKDEVELICSLPKADLVMITMHMFSLYRSREELLKAI